VLLTIVLAAPNQSPVSAQGMLKAQIGNLIAKVENAWMSSENILSAARRERPRRSRDS
jgi:hypothetical protein